MKELFLSLLNDARFNRKSEPCDCNFEELYALAREHQVVALIYSQIYNFSNLPVELKNKWKRESIKINALQTMRTECFLRLYKHLLQDGIKILVVKGLICRSLYPQPESRDSNDEDLYVQKEYYQQTYDLFLKNGLHVVSEEKDVTTFVDTSCGLSIELHKELFAKDSKAYGYFQECFLNVFDHAITHKIHEVFVYSLSYDKHLLFLILHFVKHFFHGGVGIRQVLDIVMYSENFDTKINWEHLKKELRTLHIYTLVENLYTIAQIYFHYDNPHFNTTEEYQDLLSDILDSGIFGQSTEERLHSSTITLNAIENGKVSVFKSIFPSLKEMKGKYSYLHKYPVLLPCAYISRIYRYALHNDKKQSEKTIEIGHQRVELLKKYNIIE